MEIASGISRYSGWGIERRILNEIGEKGRVSERSLEAMYSSLSM